MNRDAAPSTRGGAKPPAWRRTLGNGLRAMHLLAVSALAVALHGLPEWRAAAAGAVFASGLALFALELADDRVRWHELAGAVVLGKLGLAAVMAAWPEHAAWIFWPLIAVSALSSHAPRRWRHWPRQ
jgi:hypothetical protein